MLFTGGVDFNGQGTGPVGLGLLPIISTGAQVTIDPAATGFTPSSPTNTRLKVVVSNRGGT